MEIAINRFKNGLKTINTASMMTYLHYEYESYFNMYKVYTWKDGN